MKTLKPISRIRLFAALTGLLMFGIIGSAHAISFTTYTNVGDWSAAAGTTVLEDFDDETPGFFTSRDFGDFTGTLFNASGSREPEITSDHKLRLQVGIHTSYTRLDFDYPITALGFDWENTDPTGDDMEIDILGTNWVFGPDGGSGFFGVITTGGAFSYADFSDTLGNGGLLSHGDLDNFRYSPIPEPTTLALAGIGLLGLTYRRRKRA